MATPATIPSNYFRLHKKLLRVLGITFQQTESDGYKIYSRLMLLCTVMTYPLVQLSEINKFLDDMVKLSNALTYASLTVMGLVKCTVMFYNRKRIGRTLDMLEAGVFAPDTNRGGDQELRLVEKCVFRVNRQCTLFIGSVYSTMVLGVCGCIYRRLTSSDYNDWKFPLGVFSLFDVTHSPNYELAFVYQTFCVTMCFTGLMVCDMLISGILAHISTQFLLLQNSVRLVIRNAYAKMLKETELEDPPREIPWKYLQVSLKEVIEYHNEIIELSKWFEEQFSYVVLLQFLTSSLTLCFALYACSTVAVTDSTFIQYIGGATDIAIQVFFYCYWGNEVAIDSKAIVDACYESNFVGTDLRFQKGLILMMQRSQRPIVLTAGKFTTLSLGTYVWIVRASYSYYMMLHNLQGAR